MNIALVQPNYRHTESTGIWMANVPLGLCYIAAVLRDNDIDVEIIDANALNLTPRAVAERTRNFDAVGITGMTPAHGFITDLLKELPKGAIKIGGGPHFTGYSKMLLDDGFDIVVRGEGEYSILDIMKGRPLEKIDGISFRKKERIINNPDREPLDPNKLPLPARDLLPGNGVDMPYMGMGVESRPWSPILTSRGCPYGCYFCNKKIFGRRFRPRDPENVFKEIEYLVKEYGIKEIDIFDDTFNIDIQRAERILDMIIENNLDIKIRFSNGIRVDRVNVSLLRKLKAAGCTYIAYGIESGDQEVLDRLGKNLDLGVVKRTIRLTKLAGISVTGFFVLGLIGDTRETMQKTIDFAKETKSDVAQFTIATPYPGTNFYDMVTKDGSFLRSDWGNIYHSSGEMIYSYPGTASKAIVEKMYKKAFREFYFRPGYIFRKIISTRSFGKFKVLLRGAGAISKIGA